MKDDNNNMVVPSYSINNNLIEANNNEHEVNKTNKYNEHKHKITRTNNDDVNNDNNIL